MTKCLMSLILLSLTLSCGKGFEGKKPAKSRSQDAIEVDNFSLNQEYLTLINRRRIDLRLKPLAYSSVLEELASSHSKGMALGSRPFGHHGKGQRCRQVKTRLGRFRLCDEILAQGQENIKALFKNWLNSPEDKKELDNPDYTLTALGVYEDTNGVRYWTQMFVELK